MYLIEYSHGGDHTIEEVGGGEKSGTIVSDRAMDHLDEILLASGFPREWYRQLTESRKEERNIYKKEIIEYKKTHREWLKRINNLNKYH